MQKDQHIVPWRILEGVTVQRALELDLNLKKGGGSLMKGKGVDMRRHRGVGDARVFNEEGSEGLECSICLEEEVRISVA